MEGGNARGFTLIELLVVMVIGLMLVALVPPLFSSGVSSAEFKGAARRLAAGLRYARGYAISHNEQAVLTLDLEQRVFTVTGRKRPQQLPEQLEIELYTAKSELIDAKQGRIRFFPDGSSTGGRVTLIREEDKYEVDVSWLTGRVAILE